MYHYITARKLRNVFDQLGHGNFEVAFKDLAPRFEHRFSGDHTFGGTRHTEKSFRQWMARLHEVFPDLQFKVHNVLVKGWPWNTVAAVEWEDWGSTRDGQGYRNEGVHIIRLRWGRVVSLHVYLDTQKIAETCRRQAEHGVAQAIAPPIND